MPTQPNPQRPRYCDPEPTRAEIRRGKPWRWYIGDQYLSVRFSSEELRILICVDGRRWGRAAGGACQHDLAVVAKRVRTKLAHDQRCAAGIWF